MYVTCSLTNDLHRIFISRISITYQILSLFPYSSPPSRSQTKNDIELRAISPSHHATTAAVGENKATTLRKREVTLSKISIYIVFVFLFCHSVRIVPNGFELAQTYTEVSCTSCIDIKFTAT